MDAGDRLGVRGTPTILIEDRQVTGVISAPVLQEWVRQKREQARLASN
jgi:protein-disulfide isomerase